MTDRMVGSKSLWIAGMAIVLLAIGVVFYWPVLNGQRSMYLVDTYAFFEPMCKYLAMRLHSGQWPSWNPFLFCGVSQLAVQTPNLFYPPTFLFAWLSFSQALGWNVLFAKAAAGLGGLLLARRLRWGAVSAIFLAMLLAFNGPMFALDSNYTLAVALAWLPWILWVCHRMISHAGTSLTINHSMACGSATLSDTVLTASTQEQSSGVRGSSPLSATLASVRNASLNTTLLSIFTYLCLSAGRPETIAGVAICAAVFCVYCICVNENARVTAAVGSIVLQLVISIAIAAMLYMPVLLPAIEWLSLSRRSTGLVADEALLLSANGYDLAKMWLFPVLGDERLLEGVFTQLTGGGGSLFMPSAYVGPIAIAFCGIALGSKKWPARWLLLAAIIVTCLLSFGKNFPVTQWLVAHGGLLGILRFPVKFLPFLSVAVSFAAAKGVCLVLSETGTTSKAPFTVALFLCLTPVALALMICATPALSYSLLGFNHTTDSVLLNRALTELFKAQVWSSAVSLCLLVPLLLVTARLRRMVVAASVLICSGMLIVNGTMIGRHWANAAFYAQSSLLEPQLMRYHERADKPLSAGSAGQIAPFRIAGLYHKSCFLVPLWLLPKQPEQSAIISAAYSRQMMDSNCNVDFAIPSCWGFETAVTGDYYRVFLQALAYSTQTRRMVFAGDPSRRSDEPLARLLRLGGVEFALSQPLQLSDDGQLLEVPEMDKRFFKLLRSDRNNNYSIYKVLEPCRRARVVHDAHAVDHAEAVQRYYRVSGAAAASAAEGDRRETDDIECDGNTLKKFTTPKNETNPLVHADSHDRLVISETQPERIVCETDTDSAGFLILADQDYPGWNAFIDGRRTPIMRANGFFRAVGLPPGQHQVLFEFSPMSWQVGCRFCVCGALLLLVSIVVSAYNNFWRTRVRS